MRSAVRSVVSKRMATNTTTSYAIIPIQIFWNGRYMKKVMLHRNVNEKIQCIKDFVRVIRKYHMSHDEKKIEICWKLPFHKLFLSCKFLFDKDHTFLFRKNRYFLRLNVFQIGERKKNIVKYPPFKSNPKICR